MACWDGRRRGLLQCPDACIFHFLWSHVAARHFHQSGLAKLRKKKKKKNFPWKGQLETRICFFFFFFRCGDGFSKAFPRPRSDKTHGIMMGLKKLGSPPDGAKVSGWFVFHVRRRRGDVSPDFPRFLWCYYKMRCVMLEDCSSVWEDRWWSSWMTSVTILVV